MTYQEWVDILTREFNGIRFPILILSKGFPNGAESIEEFAMDMDLHFYQYEQGITFIDSKGDQFNWRYDKKERSNLPGDKLRTLSLEDFKSLVKNRYPKLKSDVYMAELLFSEAILRIDEAS